MPEVSVLMSVYNGEKYLRAAIDSILNQTFTDYELIVVDDGSTDNTSAILQSCDDPRLVRLRNPQNIGLTHSLNRGLEVAQGDYIARMDADDIAVPERLAQQVALMNAHPEIGLLSGDVVFIDADGNPLRDGKPRYGAAATHEVLCWQLLWVNPIPHMTVMIRKGVLDEHHLTYIPEYNTAEDHELWTELARHTRLLRADRVWAYHRRIASSVSHSRRDEQLTLQHRIVAREVRRLLDDSIPDTHIKSLFDVLYLEPDAVSESGNTVGAANLVVRAYQRFLERPLDPAERMQIQGDAVSYLLRLSRRTHGIRALYPLWQLRLVSSQEFISRNTLKMIWQGIMPRWSERP